MNVTVKDISVNYIEAGSGPDILLLHGWGSSNQVYSGIINLLKDKYHLVAPDFPGCGATPPDAAAIFYNIYNPPVFPAHPANQPLHRRC